MDAANLLSGIGYQGDERQGGKKVSYDVVKHAEAECRGRFYAHNTVSYAVQVRGRESVVHRTRYG